MSARKPEAERYCKQCSQRMHRSCGPSGRPESHAAFGRRQFCSPTCGVKARNGVGAAQARVTRWARDPWSVGPRSLLAKSCNRCGEVLPADRFGRTTTNGWHPTCRRCIGVEYRQRRPKVEVVAGWRSDYVRTQQSRFPGGIERNGLIWTGPEVELCSRTDLSAREVAGMLGRSIFAVRRQRALLKAEEPRALHLLGQSAP